MKKALMIMCMAVATSAVRAQSPISFYAEAGIGTSRLYGKHSGSDTQIACKAGIGAEYALNKTWALRSALEYRRLVIGAEAQVGLVKVNQQLRQVIDTEEFHNYLPRNFASFFTVGYKFR